MRIILKVLEAFFSICRKIIYYKPIFSIIYCMNVFDFLT